MQRLYQVAKTLIEYLILFSLNTLLQTGFFKYQNASVFNSYTKTHCPRIDQSAPLFSERWFVILSFSRFLQSGLFAGRQQAKWILIKLGI